MISPPPDAHPAAEHTEPKSNTPPRDPLIARLVRGEVAPADLLREHEGNPGKLVKRTHAPELRAELDALAWLGDVQAQLLITGYRATAVARLIQFATKGEPSELARKACVNLLKIDLAAFAPRGEDASAHGEADAPVGPSEQAILEALQQLGEEAYRA